MLGGLQGRRSASLVRGTAGKPFHLGALSSQVAPGRADDRAHCSPLQVALSTVRTSEGSANIHGRGLQLAAVGGQNKERERRR